MPKTMSIRLDDHVATLIAEQAKRRGISINQAISDAIVRSAEAELAEVDGWTTEAMARYHTVMERLG